MGGLEAFHPNRLNLSPVRPIGQGVPPPGRPNIESGILYPVLVSLEKPL